MLLGIEAQVSFYAAMADGTGGAISV